MLTPACPTPQVYMQWDANVMNRIGFEKVARSLGCQLYLPHPGEDVVLLRTGLLKHMDSYMQVGHLDMLAPTAQICTKLSSCQPCMRLNLHLFSCGTCRIPRAAGAQPKRSVQVSGQAPQAAAEICALLQAMGLLPEVHPAAADAQDDTAQADKALAQPEGQAAPEALQQAAPAPAAAPRIAAHRALAAVPSFAPEVKERLQARCSPQDVQVAQDACLTKRRTSCCSSGQHQARGLRQPRWRSSLCSWASAAGEYRVLGAAM